MAKQHSPRTKIWPSSFMSVIHLLLRMFQQHLTRCPSVTAISMPNSKSEITWPRRVWDLITSQTMILKCVILALTYTSASASLLAQLYTPYAFMNRDSLDPGPRFPSPLGYIRFEASNSLDQWSTDPGLVWLYLLKPRTDPKQ